MGGGPQNVVGYQYANSSNSFLGFFPYDAYGVTAHNRREYVQGTLTDSLLMGHNYCVSFYVSAANDCKYQIAEIGAFFQSDSIHYDTLIHVLDFVPQIVNPSSNILNDTLNWVQISGQFIAQGGEKFFIIGNFKDDANTTLDSITATYPIAYYYLDDVSVVDCTVIGLEETKNKEDVSLYPNPAKDNCTITAKRFNNAELMLYDATGRILIKQSFNERAHLDVSNLQAGVYIIEIKNNQTGSSRSEKRKLLKL